MKLDIKEVKLTRQQRRLKERKPWAFKGRKFKYMGPRSTLDVPRFETDKEGNLILSENLRTKYRKAEKAFNRGSLFYKYKGQIRVVPALPIKDITNNEEQ